MNKGVAVISQDSQHTEVKCPRCKRRIELRHMEHPSGANDGIGRLDIAQQNYSSVVCMSKPGGRYCDFMGDLDFKSMRWN